MAKKAKKQKYIRERENCYEINISAFDQKYNERVAFKKFNGDKKAALQYALSVRDQKLIDMRAGYTTANNATVKSLFDQSFELIPENWNTERYLRTVYRQCLAMFDNTKIEKIKAEDIQRSLNEYAKTHSENCVKKLKTVWKRIYNAAAKKGIRIYNQAEVVDVPKNCVYKPKKSNQISKQDYEIFMDFLWTYEGKTEQETYRNKIVYYAIRTMEFTGMRPSECYALKRSDINLITDEITVDKALHGTKDGKGEVGRTKTESSIRTIPISQALKHILKEILEFSRNDYLFSDYYGNLITSNKQTALVRKVSKKCDVEFRQYIARHDFSKKSLEAGVAPHVLRDLMGHTSSSMSIYYADSTPESRRKAIEKINEKEYA